MKKGFQLGLCFLLVACSGTVSPSVPVREIATASAVPSVPSLEPATRVVLVTPAVVTPEIAAQPVSVTPSPAAIETVTESVYDPAAWKQWPIVPVVDPSVRAIYEYGQTLGNDPQAVSIFGDCQSRPAEFLGVLDTDPASLAALPPELNEAFEYFRASFSRESPTAQDGTTPGALLWTQWHQGNFTCTFQETPVQCELRIHRPSFVIIQVGTHFESRNTEYLRKIILQLMDEGVVPILATKADNREKDERINQDMAMLASEYDLPLWNFWAAVSALPNRGLYTRDDRPLQGDIYLTAEALRIHRVTALAALDAVWRAVTGQ